MLRGAEIRARLGRREGNPKDWLVVSPLLDPGGQLNDASASIDLRLATAFVVPNRAQLAKLDPLDPGYVADKAKYNDDVFVPIGDRFILHPRQFVLGQTIEWVHLPTDLGAYVVGRSSWGRDGLVIATAAGVHPGWSGPLTLEMTNLGEIPIFLYPGLTYVQLFLHRVEGQEPAAGTTNVSAFAGTTKPVSGRPSEKDLAIVRAFRKRLQQVGEET